MLKTVFAITGKPGLYKMVSKGKNLSIFESLIDQKRIPAYVSDKVMCLGEISMFTSDEPVPLDKILNNMKVKENLQKVQLDLSKATPDDLRSYFSEILPDFDREKVYPTDIKRLIHWYNILLDVGITEFDPEEEGDEKTETEEAGTEEEAKKAKEEVKKAASASKPATQRNTTAAKKMATTAKPAAAGKMRQRTKQK